MFFDLARFRTNRIESQRREEAFVRALYNELDQVRCNVARSDFVIIEGSPLAYRRIGLVAHVFQDIPTLDPISGRARRGAYTGNDQRYVRCWWEPGKSNTADQFHWKPFAKGGDFFDFMQM